MKIVDRIRRGFERYGAGGFAKRAGELVKETVVGYEQEYVWYQLPMREERPRRELDPAFRLVEATEADLPQLLWKIDADEAHRRLRDGGSAWIVLEGDKPAFSCWTFRGRTPIRAAQGGWLELPGDTECLEESMTSPDFRGRSVAPGAWTVIADRLDARPEVRRLVTTIEEENAASRRAVEKIGFVEIARARTTKRGLRLHVEVTTSDADGEFVRRLERA